MLALIGSQIIFYLSIAIILFLPGYFLLLAIFGKSEKYITSLERFILSFGLSIIITDFIAFLYFKFNIAITALTSTIGTIIFCLICAGIYKYKQRNALPDKEKSELFSFSKNQFLLILLLLFLTIFIKTAYLTSTVAPTSTDMGHHLYWTKFIAENHTLPDYEGMPDFIIGEHIALAEIMMVSKASFFGASPILFLFLINILGILTIFILTLRIFKNKNIAILTLLFLGVLFAVSSPQAKYISGGVMGNILGNFLMPLAFYFYFRAFSVFSVNSQTEPTEHKNSRIFLSLAVFITFGLFYTHHLTAFIFLFILFLTIILFFVVNYKDFGIILKKVMRVIISPAVSGTFILGLIFFFFVFTPTYMQNNAVETAVGIPSKATREGLSLANLKDSVGEARLAFGVIGFFMLIIAFRKKNFGLVLIIAWTSMLFIMSTAPQLLLINLPSSRIGNYMSYPLAILSSFGLYFIFKPDFRNFKFKKFDYSAPPIKFFGGLFFLLLTFVLTNGLIDSAQSFKKSSNFTPTLETFNASEYLVKNTSSSDMVVKDHNYLTGDTWMKLFFMRGYTYPLSRSYFKRYEDSTKSREMCTLFMISNPAGKDATACFSETNTRYIVLNPKYDSSQFRKLKNFNSIYNSGNVAIYYRK